MSPLLEPAAARPHATDRAPCLNRCSINNACFSATHTHTYARTHIHMRAHTPWWPNWEERDGRGGGESVWRKAGREADWAGTQELE